MPSNAMSASFRDGSRHRDLRLREEPCLLHDVDRGLAVAGARGEDVVEIEEQELDGGLGLRVAERGRAGPRAVEDLIDPHGGKAFSGERGGRPVVDERAVVAAGAVRIEDDRVAARRHRALRRDGNRQREAQIEGVLQLRLAVLDDEAAAVLRLAERHVAGLVIRRGTIVALVDHHVRAFFLAGPVLRGGHRHVLHDVIHRRERLLRGVVRGEHRQMNDVGAGDAGAAQLGHRRRIEVVHGARAITHGPEVEDLGELVGRGDERAGGRAHLVRDHHRVARLRAQRAAEHRQHRQRVGRPVHRLGGLPVDLREMALAVLGRRRVDVDDLHRRIVRHRGRGVGRQGLRVDGAVEAETGGRRGREALQQALGRRHVLGQERQPLRVGESLEYGGAVRVFPQIAGKRMVEERLSIEHVERRRYDEHRPHSGRCGRARRRGASDDGEQGHDRGAEKVTHRGWGYSTPSGRAGWLDNFACGQKET